MRVNADILRIISDPPLNGFMNMALDEAILEGIAYGDSPATIRFYSWSNPVLTIGRNQRLSDINLKETEKTGISVIRRPTGGNAVLHDDEMTYSVSFRIPKGVESGIVPTCRMIHSAIKEALSESGIQAYMAPEHKPERHPNPVCFAEPSDTEIIIGGIKAIGSAQMRRAGVLMQHGSIPFSLDRWRLMRLFSLREPMDMPLTSGIRIKGIKEQFKRAFALSMAKTLNLKPEKGNYSKEEIETAENLSTEKYSSKEWTERK